MVCFFTDGKFTDDPFDAEFFGSGKVVQKEGINDICKYMADNGYKHHVGISLSDSKDALVEAFEKYLGIETKVF